MYETRIKMLGFIYDVLKQKYLLFFQDTVNVRFPEVTSVLH
jgi:hypothetical protein